jgi:hypothetical protein
MQRQWTCNALAAARFRAWYAKLASAGGLVGFAVVGVAAGCAVRTTVVGTWQVPAQTGDSRPALRRRGPESSSPWADVAGVGPVRCGRRCARGEPNLKRRCQTWRTIVGNGVGALVGKDVGDVAAGDMGEGGGVGLPFLNAQKTTAVSTSNVRRTGSNVHRRGCTNEH